MVLLEFNKIDNIFYDIYFFITYIITYLFLKFNYFLNFIF